MDDKTKKSLAQRARERLLKAISTSPYSEDDDDEDDGPPSQEDRDKEAAPKEAPAAPAGAPGQAGPPQDDDDGDEGGDGGPDGDDDNADDESEGDQDEAPPQLPMKKPGKPPMGKSLTAASDEEMRAELLRRAEAAPEFLKSLVTGDDAQDIWEAIDLSAPVALLVQAASEQIAQKDVQIAQLTKSLQDFADARSEDVANQEAVLKGMAALLGQGEALTKSLTDLGADVALIKSQDSGKVSAGQRNVILPDRREPVSEADKDEDAERRGNVPEGVNKNRLARALTKSHASGAITEQQYGNFLGRLDGGTGLVGVWDEVPEAVRELALAAK